MVLRLFSFRIKKYNEFLCLIYLQFDVPTYNIQTLTLYFVKFHAIQWDAQRNFEHFTL